MPSKSIGQEVTRGTICRDRWRATVTLVCSDRIAPGTTSPLLVTVTWRRLKSGGEQPGQPDDAKAVVLELRSRRAGGGEVRFDADDGPTSKRYRTDASEVLQLFGTTATTGNEPDVDLFVSIEGESRGSIALTVGTSAVDVAIRAENGTDPPSPTATLDQAQRFKAAVTPAGAGTFQWISGLPATLQIQGAADHDLVQVIAHPPPPAIRFLPLLVAFSPQGGPMVVAVHNLDVRESIIFILGVDPAGTPNPFYAAATTHFRRNPANRIETSLRTLVAVRDFLENNPPSNGQPWGDVSLVVHATEEGGMSIPVVPPPPDGNPTFWNATPLLLSAAIHDRLIAPLPDRLVDARTLLRIRGCALGRSQDMLHQLSLAFGGDDPQRPIVRAPKDLQAYEVLTSRTGQVTGTDEHPVEFWFIGFPSGQRPSEADMIAQFRQANGDPPRLDWRAAIRRTEPRSGVLEDAYRQERTRTFVWVQSFSPTPTTDAQLAALVHELVAGSSRWTNIQETSRTRTPNGKLTILYTALDRGQPISDGRINLDVRPDLVGQARIRDFLSSLRPDPDRDISSPTVDLARAGHTVNDYTWAVRDTADNGRPAVRITGTRTIVRIQREVTEEDPDHPGQRRRAHPPITDLTHFGAELPPGATP